MERITRWKVPAVLVALGALLVLGASQTALQPRHASAEQGDLACAGPVKAFQFSLGEVERARVSALMVRIAPDVMPTQLRYGPKPQEILPHRDGTIELRYTYGTLPYADALTIELCGASLAHEIREAYWIVREQNQTIAKMVNADEIAWQWREGGYRAIPGTRRVAKELSCTGDPLVRPYDIVNKAQPLCIKDPKALARIEAQVAQLQAERTTFVGKLTALLWGEQPYERRLAELNADMEQLYLYSPYQGTVVGVRHDNVNGLAWIELKVEEETSDIQVSQ